MNILLIRLSAIGDVVMATGLVPALKAKYPESRITWLAEPGPAQLLLDNNNIDQVLIWPKGQWKAYWQAHKLIKLAKSILDFRAQLRDQSFDMVLDTQGILKSGVLAWMSGCRDTIGLGSKEGSWIFHRETLPRPADDPAICSEYTLLADHLKLPPASFAMSLPYSPSVAARAQHLLAAGSASKPYAVVCPFTTRPQKHWLDRHWSELMKSLRQRLSMNVVMLGGSADREHARQLIELANIDVVNLVGETSLLEAVALIDRASLLVGVDTGLTHIGIAKNTPTVALFGSTRPYTDTRHACAKVLYENMSCAPCRRRPTCGGDFTCMKNLTPARVIAEIEALIA